MTRTTTYSSNDINECLHIEGMRALRMQNALRPRFGAQVPRFNADEPLIYDVYKDECEALNGATDDEQRFFDHNRYVMMGSVFYEEPGSVCILSPYFIRFEIDPQSFKSAKQLVPKIKKDVKRFLSAVQSKVPTVNMRPMNTEDAEKIGPDAAYVGYGIQELQRYMQWQGYLSIPEIFLQNPLGLINGDNLDFLISGFGPQYYFNFIPKDYAAEAASQCSYSQMSVDDFMQRVTGQPSMVQTSQEDYDAEKEDSNKMPSVDPISFEKLKESHKGLSLLEFYVPVVMEMTVE